MTSRDTLEHLQACFDTMYEVLGASATSLTNDAYVIRTYELARSMGEVALTFREYLGEVSTEPVTALRDVLVDAVGEDMTGAMVLYCVAMVVGPRVLVSLRDAREFGELDDDERELTNSASQVLLREMLAVGGVASSQAPIEDEKWQASARELSERLENGGNAESFGFSR